MIIIEQGIEMPNSKNEFPFATMNVKESFLVPELTSTRSMTTSIKNFNKKEDANKSFKAFLVEGGVRVWRTA